MDGSERVFDEAELIQDNLSAIFIMEHPYAGYRGIKHMRVRYYYLRELVMRGGVSLRWVRSADMVSDILSKCVALHIFTALLPRLLG
jgi:hypothetical protein